ncbi:MAG: magnesium transporter CorA family protein [Nitrososphaeraceae archaeon]
MQTSIAYNDNEVKQSGTKEDITKGYKLWLDVIDPTSSEIQDIQQIYDLDKNTLEIFMNKSKKPQIRMSNAQIFTLILDIKYKDLRTLATEALYIFKGKDWLITIHSSKVDLIPNVNALLEQKNVRIMEATIDALYYSIMTEVIGKYEQLLTSIEMTVTNFEQKSLYKPSRKMLDYLDTLSRQIIILRRHFWHTRDIINYLKHMEKDTEEIMYIEIAYDNITQLIELVESYRDTLNSTRDLYIANVSLQMNDTMRLLTLFSAILLPLSFIVGLFGMNGIDLNDLSHISVSVITVAIVMGAIVLVMFLYFKKKEWILHKEQNIDQ